MPNQESLQQYFANYLTVIKGNKPSTVKHYFDALNNISNFANEHHICDGSIYEIKDMDVLLQIKEQVYAHPDFQHYNSVGHSMYSAGLNNYIKFAQGEDFAKLTGDVSVVDIPILAPSTTIATRKQYPRSTIIRNQTIQLAHYKCEMNPEHETFIAASTQHPYMEGHHVIPVNKQEYFDNSLDVYANVVCLCPICHRRMHLGLKQDKEAMLGKIYVDRRTRLIKSGLDINKDDFVRLATSR